MITAIFFALVSYLGWGIGDIFGTVATRKVGGYSTTFWSYVVWILIDTPLVLFFLNELKDMSVGIFLLIIALGILGIVPLIVFYEALKVGPASVVGTIVASFAALTVVFSIIFLGDQISLVQAIAITVIFIGLVLSTLDLGEIKNGRSIIGKGVALALLAAFLWGIFFTFIKIPVQEVGWFWPIYLANIIPFPLVFLLMKFRGINLQPVKGFIFPLFASAVLLQIGAFSFNYAISQGLTSIVAPIAGSYPTLFVLLAFIFFKDRITK